MGEATSIFLIYQYQSAISIHASRGGSDRDSVEQFRTCKNFNPRFPWGKRPTLQRILVCPSRFQSTLPVGEATLHERLADELKQISIHASRGGSDFYLFNIPIPVCYFNPRFPWGKRLYLFRIEYGDINFNPRFPWGKRQKAYLPAIRRARFQSTLPVGEATSNGFLL